MIYLIQGAGFGVFAASQPGSLQTYLISRSLQNGWRCTLPAAFAPLLSDGPIIMLVVLILSQIPEWFQRGLRIGGGLFILYLAYGAIQAFRRGDIEDDIEPDENAGRQSVLEVAVINLLNPNPYIFWSFVAGPILVEAWQQSPLLGLGFVGAFYGVFIVINMLIIVAFGKAGQLDARIRRGLMLVSAVALGAFGIYQIVQGLLSTGI